MDQSLRSASLLSNSLHAHNILVNPNNPVELVAIIDWQSREMLPLYHHAQQPNFLDHDGPQVEGLEGASFDNRIKDGRKALNLFAAHKSWMG